MSTIKNLLKKASERKDVIAFLHFTEIEAIHKLCNIGVGKMDFNSAVSAFVASDSTKAAKISALTILVNSNDCLRTERYRFDVGNKLFEYSQEQNAYVFWKYCTTKDFKLHYANVYID